jgi:lysophospholipase L1-like esterase
VNRQTCPFYQLLVLVAGLAVLNGCSIIKKPRVGQEVGESVVLIGEEPAYLSHLPLLNQPIHVRSTYLPETGTIEYINGNDFVLDGENGSLRRTPVSRTPDFRTNILFGKEMFDHSQFPGFGNAGFFIFVDYAFAGTNEWPVQQSQVGRLRATQSKLLNGQVVKIVAFGDSITAGGNASRPNRVFWQRWADELQRKYPTAQVTTVNGATGGDSTRQGLERLQTKVLAEKPDLVLIGFGMNDHNVNGVPLPQFKANLKEMVALIRAKTGADIILFSAFPPNPRWKFGSHHMADYAVATAQAARETACAYADVFDNWQSLAARKKPEDLLGNNINHPNDFGHWIYYSVFTKLGL